MGLKVTPATATITISGGSQQFKAIETFSDGTTFDRTEDPVTVWSAVNIPIGGAAVATLSPDGIGAGLATGNVIGQSAITATYGVAGPTDTATLTVTAPNPGIAGPAPDLKTASTYGIIATNAITNSSGPLTHIFGDVALTLPSSTSTSVVGFFDGGALPALTSTNVTNSDGMSPGLINTTDNGVLSLVQLAQLQTDLNDAYLDLSGRAPTSVYPTGVKDLSGLIITPGIYAVGGVVGVPGVPAVTDTLGLSGPVVLDAQGNADAVFIFQAHDITTTTGSVILQGGAQPQNVFWVLTATATIGNGASTFFQGTIVAGNTITVNLNTNVQGRMLAGALGAGAITVNGIITVPQ